MIGEGCRSISSQSLLSFCILPQVKSLNVTSALKQANLAPWNSLSPREMRSCTWSLSSFRLPAINTVPLGKHYACRDTLWLGYPCKSLSDTAFHLKFSRRERTVTASSVPTNSRLLAANKQPDTRRNLYVLGLPFDLVKYVPSAVRYFRLLLTTLLGVNSWRYSPGTAEYHMPSSSPPSTMPRVDVALSSCPPMRRLAWRLVRSRAPKSGAYSFRLHTVC